MLAERSADATDLVVLVPGFLGFEALGDFCYFDDNVLVALNAALARSPGQRFAVKRIATEPSGSLSERQAMLVGLLGYELKRYPKVQRMHLVGHSTGGVDVRLLMAHSPILGGTWSGEAERIREKLRAVVAVASPQHGSHVVEDEFVGSFGPLDHRFFSGLLARRFLARELAELAGDSVVRHFLWVALRNIRSAASFMERLFRNRKLVDDLRPRAMAERRLLKPALEAGRFRTVVSMAALRVDAHEGMPERIPDGLFSWFYEMTAAKVSYADPDDARVTGRTRERLLSLFAARAESLPKVPIIRHPFSVLREVELGLSDGLCNSCRQVFDPDREDELLAVVVGDHVDVVGHYDRPEAGALRANAGLLRSGSGFGDRQLAAMWACIAHEIMRAAQEAP